MDGKEKAGSPKSGMTRSRKPPRWVVPFLRALERTGEVEAAARDAGIDKSTAYARRKVHADFAAAWEGVLARRDGAAEAQVTERVGFWERVRKGGLAAVPAILRVPSTTESALSGPPPRPGEELMTSTALGGKVVRAGAGRWSAAKEKRFFDELAASANVKRACAAAGVSSNAIYARRMKRPDFRAKWDAVLESGRAAIEMHLIETAKKAFDPEEMDVEGVQPKVSVAEAIRIVKLHGNKADKQEIEQVEPPAHEVAAIRERLVRKLERLKLRFREEELAAGWSYDEEHDMTVPPGWVKA